MLHNIFLLHSHNTTQKVKSILQKTHWQYPVIFRSTTVSKFSVSGLAATSGLSLPQTDQQSEAGAAARVWLRPSEVFGLDWDFVCQRAQEMETKRERERETAGTIKLLQRQSVCLGDGWSVLYMCMRVCLKLFCTIWNFQKIPAEIILGHEHVFVCICSQQMVK